MKYLLFPKWGYFPVMELCVSMRILAYFIRHVEQLVLQIISSAFILTQSSVLCAYNRQMAQITYPPLVSTVSSPVVSSSVAGSIYRPDGRSADALREVRFTPNFVATAEGSVLVETGNTRVLCNATVETGVPGWMRNSGRGWVTAEYGMLPRATLTRTARESERGKVGGRTHEIQRLIGRSLRAVVDMKALGERTIILDCDVLQADGGTRTAAITGAAVALAIALGKLVAAGTLKTSPLRQMLAATSVGIVDGNILLDLAYEEDSRADVDMNVVMLADGGLVETQATAERVAYSREQLARMLDYAEKGIRELLAAQQAALAAAV